MISAPGITVNGVKIGIEQINAEVQYHPAENLPDAKYKAMQALVIRELLLQQAVKKGLCTREDIKDKADDIIDRLLEQELTVLKPTDAECRRYYENNAKRFVAAPLFEVSHILYAAMPGRSDAREAALLRARKSLERIKSGEAKFEDIAAVDSACPSGKQGGNLGQISKNQTVPAFEAALFKMREGELSKNPVESEVGYHLIQVHKRIDGKPLPYEAVSEWVADFLSKQNWQRAFSQYVKILIGEAEISGFHLKGADSPLVQ